MQTNETISFTFVDSDSVFIHILSRWQYVFCGDGGAACFRIYYIVIMWYLTFSPGGPMAPWGPGSPCVNETKCLQHCIWWIREKSNVRLPVHHWPGHLDCLAVQEVLALLEVPETVRLILELSLYTERLINLFTWRKCPMWKQAWFVVH